MQTGTKIELHGFSDASKKAYGGNIYVRATDDRGCFTTVLLTSKSKIAPLTNEPRIPRLELQGAVILSKMLKHTIQVCEFVDVPYYAWTESTIVLHWLRCTPNTLKTFVANRIATIAENTPTSIWAHVKSEDNPADLISRGISAEDLVRSKFWKHGPNWLLKDKAEWPKPKLAVTKDDKEAILKECKPKSVNAMLMCTPISFQDWTLIERFSSWQKIVRITAIAMRFIYNARQKNQRREKPEKHSKPKKSEMPLVIGSNAHKQSHIATRLTV